MAEENALKMQVEQCIVEWTAKKPIIGEWRNSPIFIYQKSECYFRLSSGLYQNTDYRLYIRNKRPSLPFDVTVYVVNGTECISYPTKTVQFEDSLIWSCTKSEFSKHVPDFEERSSCCFRVIFHGGSRTSPGQTNTDRVVQTPSDGLVTNLCLESLSKDFSKLLDGHGDSHHDVKVKCGDHVFHAHRSVLSARSEVFSAMLKSDMVESRTGLVELQDMDPDIFHEFMRYLYTGTIRELTVDKAKKFHEAGDKYAVRRLMQRCANFLKENLTAENACECLVLADYHSDQDFKDGVISFILDKNIPLNDSNWPTFCNDHPKLANEVLNRGFKLLSAK